MVAHAALLYIGFVAGISFMFLLLILLSDRYPERMTWFTEDEQ